MAQFILNWDNTAALADANATGQRVSYRRKDVGGSFLITGFSPANDLPKSATTATSPVLTNNVVYELKVQTLCTVNGPTDNSNGIIEQIGFVCIEPEITQTDIASTITISILGLNITKARFTLRKQSDSSIVDGPTVVVAAGNFISRTAAGLTASTGYYWEVELYATINGVEVISSDAAYLNAVCGPYEFETEAPTTCPAPQDLTVDAIAG